MSPPSQDTGFVLSLSPEEKSYLHAIARERLRQKLDGEKVVVAPPPGDADGPLHRELGAFVTLTIDGHLRGCIGNLVGQGPLFLTVASMAESAGFRDPRFRPLRKEEFPAIHTEISVMGPILPCPDPGAVVIGKHGLIMRRGNRQGLLLPQVPVEHGWDRETFLAQTCRKAGLPPDAWRDKETSILWFEAMVF